MDIQKYKDRIAKGVPTQSLLEFAFVEEEGLIDYQKFLEQVVGLPEATAKREVEYFYKTYYAIQDYPKFKAMYDAGASFEEIAEILREGICVICHDAWLAAVDLLMKLFKLSYEEVSERL